MGATNRKRQEPAPGMLICSVCRLTMPRDAFPVITVRDRRCKPGHSWTGPAYECRECRKLQRREWRRRKAEAAGKEFVERGDRTAWEARQRTARERRKAEGMARLSRHIAEQKAAAQERRDLIQSSVSLTCTVCSMTKDRGQFYPSMLRNADVVCVACVSLRDARQFQVSKESLSDAYVKRQIAKSTGLSARLMPPALVEAKRVQLMIERALPSDAKLYEIWIRRALAGGPVDAEELNRRARSAGFRIDRLRPQRRSAGAVYDITNNTWRLA